MFKTKAIGVCGKNIQRVKIETWGKTTEQVSNFKSVGNQELTLGVYKVHYNTVFMK
jgi:hypothetical protein